MRKRAIGQIIVNSIFAVILTVVLTFSIVFARISNYDSTMAGSISGTISEFFRTDSLIQKTVEITEKAFQSLPVPNLRFFGCAPVITFSDHDIGIPGPLKNGYTAGPAVYEGTIQDISIEWASGRIFVAAHDLPSGVYIAEYSGSVDPSLEIPLKASDVTGDEQMVHKLRGTKLKIEEFRSSVMLPGIHNTISKTLVVLVPSAALTELSIDSAASDIVVTGISARALDLDLAAGKLDVSDCLFDKVDIDAAAASGAFSVTRIGSLDLDSATGDFRFDLINTPDKVDADLMSANLSFTLPSDASFSVELDSVAGSLVINGFAQTQTGKRTVVNGGSSYFDFDLAGGTVTIEPALCDTGSGTF